MTTAFGPERRGAKFELAKPAGVNEDIARSKSIDVESLGAEPEKVGVSQTEYVAEKQ